MRYLFLLLLLSQMTVAQSVRNSPNSVERPKLVVGLVVDQMRWDFLYRYYDRYAADGGFKRMLNKGFSCENTFINYLPTYTACGHTCLYTGSVPAVHGIAGNEWWDNHLHKQIYCAGDDSVEKVGGAPGPEGKMSPRNMLATTICDELRIATNFRSKVIGVAMKDRGGILPAGHAANAAYWLDGTTGNWISSTYYMKELPKWVIEFNNRKLPDQYFKKGWKTLYPINTYNQSVPHDVQHPAGSKTGGFPYNYDEYVGKNYHQVPGTPYGNTITKEMAMAAITAEELGKDSITDFLALSFSTPDYIGHRFGPNAIEVEDTYLRLDREFGELFKFLDSKVGKDQYLVFLSADHGVAHSPDFSAQNKLPGGGIAYGSIERRLDSLLRAKFGNHQFIEATENNQIFFDHRLIDSVKADGKAISDFVIDYFSRQEGIDRAFATSGIMTMAVPSKLRDRIANGFHPRRSGDVQVLFKAGYIPGGGSGSTHGSWHPYDAHIPLVWYGWKIKHGKTNRETYMTDVAPTIAAMLRIQMPSGTVGNVIEEVANPR